jgi:hypothetical protein
MSMAAAMWSASLSVMIVTDSAGTAAMLPETQNSKLKTQEPRTPGASSTKGRLQLTGRPHMQFLSFES